MKYNVCNLGLSCRCQFYHLKILFAISLTINSNENIDSNEAGNLDRCTIEYLIEYNVAHCLLV